MRKVRCDNCKALMTYNEEKNRWECTLCGNSWKEKKVDEFLNRFET